MNTILKKSAILMRIKLIDIKYYINTEYYIAGVLQELIQNADDARATEVKFLLDCTQYSTDRVFSEEMNPYQVCYRTVYMNHCCYRSHSNLSS